MECLPCTKEKRGNLGRVLTDHANQTGNQRFHSREMRHEARVPFIVVLNHFEFFEQLPEEETRRGRIGHREKKKGQKADRPGRQKSLI